MSFPNRPSNPEQTLPEPRTFIRRYTWVIVKNIIGWVLILSAMVVGSVLPVPLGTPMFFIGFALVNFPGKRRLTSTALRGIPIDLRSHNVRLWRLAVSLILPAAVLWFLAHEPHPVLHPTRLPLLQLCGLYVAAIVAAWILVWLLLLGVNAIVRILPRLRRRVRPWLRQRGINLLPPRRKRPAKI